MLLYNDYQPTFLINFKYKYEQKCMFQLQGAFEMNRYGIVRNLLGDFVKKLDTNELKMWFPFTNLIFMAIF